MRTLFQIAAAFVRVTHTEMWCASVTQCFVLFFDSTQGLTDGADPLRLIGLQDGKRLTHNSAVLFKKILKHKAD